MRTLRPLVRSRREISHPLRSNQGYGEDVEGLAAEAVALLRVWSLRVDRELRVIVCSTCEHALTQTGKGIMNHLQKRHASKGHLVRTANPTLQADLERLLQGFRFSEPGSIANQPADRAAIPGIKVHRGYYCPVQLPGGTQCRRAYPAISSLATHVKKEHPKTDDRPKPSQLSRHACDCQTIFIGSTRRYFKVKTGLEAEGAYSVFVRNVADKIPDSSKVQEEIKNEELPSLLRATQWHDFIGNYRGEPEDVVDLARYPVRAGLAEGDVDRALAKLPYVSDAWMAKVGGYHGSATDRMRRALNGYPM